METDRIPVRIKLRTIIDDNGQMEYNTMSCSGVLRKAKHADVLIFNETNEGESGAIKNLVTIKAGEASIKRTGALSMHQQFREGTITENAFMHPYGHMHMETKTERFSYETADTGAGTLAIHYTVKLNGQEERQHELMLQYQKEDEGK